jgi:aryl-alcohol dehydrogenase-like predicted oxidoreductase
LAVKIRQREGQSLDTIKADVKGTTGDVLEKRVANSLERVLLAKADIVVTHDDDPLASWRRIAVADGIELHVREDSIGARDEAMVAMREAVRAALGRMELR